MKCIYCGKELDEPGAEPLYWQPDMSEIFNKYADEKVSQHIEYIRKARNLVGDTSGYTQVYSQGSIRLCPRCHSIVPEIKSEEEVIRIGLIGLQGSGKTSFLCSFAAENFKACYEGNMQRFEFARMQEESADLERRLDDPKAVLSGKISDSLHDDFMLQVLRFSKDGTVYPTAEQYPYPFLVRVKDCVRNKSKVLSFYDISGKVLQDYFEAKDSVWNLSYLNDLRWIFYFIDAKHISFENNKNKKKLEEDNELIKNVEMFYNDKGENRPGVSIIFTKSDMVTRSIEKILKRGNVSGYSPEIECVRSYLLSQKPGVQKLLGFVQAEEGRHIQLHMISVGRVRAQYTASSVFDMLLYLMEKTN